MKYMLWLSAVLACNSFAAQLPSFQAEQATKTLFTDITATDSKVIAVGQHGTIVYSNDGNQWQQAQSPIDLLLTAVFFVDENVGYACGHDASILKTTDGGQSWALQQHKPEIDKPCLDIHFFNPEQGIAIGAYGMYFQTQDGGSTWEKRFLDELLFEEDRDYLARLKEEDPEGYEIETSAILPHFNRITDTGNALYMAGEMGLMARSDDNAKTWQRVEEIYHGSFFDIEQTQQGLIVAGLRGNAFIKKDDSDFVQLESSENATMNSIVQADGRVYIVANSGVIYTLDDNGESLSAQSRADGKAVLNAVRFNGQLVLATEAGIQTMELQ